MKGSIWSLKTVLTTLFVILAAAGMARLGFWQLERLEQRRAFNARVAAQLEADPLDLNQSLPSDDDLYAMEYRTVQVVGTYRSDETALLRNQAWEGQLGYHVLTPLQIEGSSVSILVDRGWIPFEQGQQVDLAAFGEEGQVTILGMIQRSKPDPTFGAVEPTLAPGDTHRTAWNRVNLDKIDAELDADLLGVYLVQAPTAGQADQLPLRALPAPELDEGSHFGYALQWFSFSAIAALGYPIYLWRSSRQGRISSRSAVPVAHDRREKQRG